MLTVMLVMGTRPEIIKLAPIVQRLRRSPDVRVRVVLTGQHRELLTGLLNLFDLEPETDLEVMGNNQSIAMTTAAVLTGMDQILKAEKPDLLLVQGDTTTAFAAAATAFFHKVSVGHVEAGLRTDNKYSPFPEELNRRWISVTADFHFAPTLLSKQNLLRESTPEQNIFVTGNTVIDALLFTTERLKTVVPSVPAPTRRPFVLVTVHRRENHGAPMVEICDAILQIVANHEDFEVVLPVHANPNVSTVVNAKLGSHPRIRLVKPLDYLSFVDHMKSSYLLLTDSGGVQEEAPVFHKPILVMRTTTERPEGIDSGTSELVGCNKATIVKRVGELILDKSEYAGFARAKNPYGDGLAAQRTVNAIGHAFDVSSLIEEVPDFDAGTVNTDAMRSLF